MNEEASAIVVDISNELIEGMNRIAPTWQHAFWRFNSDESSHGSAASYVVESSVTLIDALKHGALLHDLERNGLRLLHTLGCGLRAVVLVTVDSKANFKIAFEWDNMERWRITKLDGADGIPEGVTLKRPWWKFW
jgi:hypothetical protein